MIDFRYHVVSLVSVFLALAVGIVLGAGPLKESIGDTLSEQVNSLRADRDQLREDLDRTSTALAHRDEFISAVSPQLVADQLGGRTVVLVSLPGSLADDVKPLTEALTQSGATVTGRVSVQDAWSDPSREAERKALVDRLTTLVGPGPDGAQQTLEALLARALVTDDLAASGVASPVGAALLDSLSKAGLVKVDDAPTGRASEAVLLAPAIAAAVESSPSPSLTQQVESDVSAWSSLALALDTASDGSVAYGPASSAGQGGTIEKIRSDSSVAQHVSSVDTGGTSMGAPTTVLALGEQLRDEAGAYGFGPGAKAPLPATNEETP
jgi:outer membrane murein-binding lipoprotein Lpp